MHKKVIIGVVVAFVVVLIVNFLNTKDLSTYETYDISSNSVEIVNCFDYYDTVYSNYLCVVDYINEQKVENPTDVPIALRTRIYKTRDGSIDMEFQTPYINSKIDFIPDWWNEYSNQFFTSTILCNNSSEIYCSGLGNFSMSGMNRGEAIEQFNYAIDNWEYDDIIYYSESEVVVFPEDNVNNEKYMSLISINGENMDEFWSEIEKGIEKGEIKAVE